MGKIRDDCDHVVVKAVTNVCVGTMPHGRSHSKSCESSLCSLDLFLATSPIRIIANSSCGMIIGNVRSIIAWFIDDHLFIAKVFKSVFFVVTNVTSSVRCVWSTSAPSVSLIHIVMGSAVAFEIVDHACPSIFLRLR
jgi:hypothetical protein